MTREREIITMGFDGSCFVERDFFFGMAGGSKNYGCVERNTNVAQVFSDLRFHTK